MPSLNDDVSSGVNPVGNVGRGGWMKKYRERIYLPGKTTASFVVPGLRGGFSSEVNDGSPWDPAWQRDVYRLILDTIQSDVATPPGV